MVLFLSERLEIKPHTAVFSSRQSFGPILLEQFEQRPRGGRARSLLLIERPVAIAPWAASTSIVSP